MAADPRDECREKSPRDLSLGMASGCGEGPWCFPNATFGRAFCSGAHGSPDEKRAPRR